MEVEQSSHAAEFAQPGYFHSDDPIQNLQVRVTLYKIVGEASAHIEAADEDDDKFEKTLDKEMNDLNLDGDKEDGNDEDGVDTSKDVEGSEDGGESSTSRTKKSRFTRRASKMMEERREIDQRVVQWQQKVFGRRELELYDDLRARRDETGTLSGGAQDDAYIDESTNPAARAQNIFTYVDTDGYIDTGEYKKTFSQAAHKMTLLQRKVLDATLKPKRGVPSEWSFGVFYPPKLKLSKFHHLNENTSQVMHIMCTPDIQNPKAEYPLCFIKANSDGSLEMKPKFNDETTSAGYFFRTPDGTKFEYTIEVHEDKFVDEFEEERKQFKLDGLLRELEARKNLIGSDFSTLTTKDTKREYIFGEIVYAIDFAADPLYIEYDLEVPQGWKLEKSCIPTAATQISNPIQENDPELDNVNIHQEMYHQVHHYCMPFEFEFTVNVELANSKPKIFLQAKSYDYWDRNRVEGYGYVNVPTEAGVYCERVRTWKPVGTVREMMKSLWVGGSVELQDSKYTAIPSGIDGPVMNRFGFRTVNSGQIQVRMNVVTQDPVSQEPTRPAGAHAQHLSAVSSSDDPSKREIQQKAKMRVARIRKNKQQQASSGSLI